MSGTRVALCLLAAVLGVSAPASAQMIPRMPQFDAATQEKLDALEAARKAGAITEEEYKRKKAEILAGAFPAPKKPSDAPPPTPWKKGKTYRHVIGFSFWYPDGWTVKEQEGFLQVVPPDPGTQEGAPTELYFIIGESLDDEAIQKPIDPQVVEYLNGAIRKLAPAMQRVGQPSPIAVAQGQGAVLDWEARSPQGGVVRARAFVSIIKRHGVALVALGLKDRLDTRDADLREMFASFGLGEGQRDPQLVGTWRLVSTYALTNESPFETDWSRAKMVSESRSDIVFRADGTWSRRDQRYLLAGAGGTWIEDKQDKTTKGRWNAGGGALFLLGDDSSWNDYQYQLRQGGQGRQLRLASGKNGQVWQETR